MDMIGSANSHSYCFLLVPADMIQIHCTVEKSAAMLIAGYGFQNFPGDGGTKTEFAPVGFMYNGYTCSSSIFAAR
jgi:hypothetical protein